MQFITTSLLTLLVAGAIAAPVNMVEERQSCTLSYSLSYNIYFGYCSGNHTLIANKASEQDTVHVPVMLRAA